METEDRRPRSSSRRPSDRGCACPALHRQGRNLAICIDGTSNQFGKLNTNVINLYRQLHKDEFQLTYYNSGIGTYATPSWKSWAYWRQVFDNKIDLAIAWNFEKIVLKAYRWLADNYRPGDRIFLFGFSRGAYQVRTLAGMIHKIGLIHKGNEEQIPFAYEIYADPKSDAPLFSQEYEMKLNSVASEKLRSYRRKMPSAAAAEQNQDRSQNQNLNQSNMTSASTTPSNTPSLAEWFKSTFSRDIRVHFVGVWDTVSSIGVVRGKNLPGTVSPEHICFFRHALALDERRVKFLPEYARGGVLLKPAERPDSSGASMPSQATVQGEAEAKEGETPVSSEANPEAGRKLLSVPHIKETWFTGTHSDVGGKNGLSPDLDHSIAPLLWMSYEAMSAGLAMNVPKEWKWQEWDTVNESLTGVWKAFEYLPFTRLTYKDESSMTSRLHRGRGRKIKPGQTIHASVAFSPDRYVPKAHLPPSDKPKSWRDLIKSRGKDEFVCPEGWEGLLEMDIFDVSTANAIIENLTNRDVDASLSVHRLTVLTWSSGGCSALCDVLDAPDRVFMSLQEPHIQGDVELQIQVINALIEFANVIPCITQSGSLHSLTPLLHDARHRSSAHRFLGKFCPAGIHRLLLDQKLFADLEKILEDEDNLQHVQQSVLNAIQSVCDRTESQSDLFNNLRAMLDSEEKPSQLISLRATSEIAKRYAACEKTLEFGSFEPLIRRIADSDADVQRCCFVAIEQLARQDGPRNNLLESELIKATIDMLKSTEEHVQRSGLDLTAALIAYDDSRRQIFESELSGALPNLFRLGRWIVRHSLLECISRFAPHEHIWDDGYNTALGPTAITLGTENAQLASWVSEEVQGSQLASVFVPDLVDNAALSGGTQAVEDATPDETKTKVFEADEIARLVTQLGDEDDDARQSSITAIAGMIQYEDARSKLLQTNAVGLLLHLFSDKSWVVRQSSVDAIGALMQFDDPRFKLFETDAIARILVLFGDEDVDVRQSSMKAITAMFPLDDVRTKLLENNTVRRFLSLFQDYSWRVRQMSVDAISSLMQYDNARSKIFKTDAVNLILRLFSDDDSDVRRSALNNILAMMKLDDAGSEAPRADAYTALHRLFGAENSYQRQLAVQAMTEMMSLENAWSKIFHADALVSLLDLFQDANWLVRQSSVQTITAMMQFDEARSSLLKLDVITRILALFEDADGDVRYSSVEAITKMLQFDDSRHILFEADPVDRIFGLFTNESWRVRQSSVQIIAAMIGFGDAPSQLFETNTATCVLALFGDDDSDVQRSAVEAVTAIMESEDARSDLTKAEVSAQFLGLLKDHNWRVRRLCLDVIATSLQRSDKVQSKFMKANVATLILDLFTDEDSAVRQSSVKTITVMLQATEGHSMLIETDTLHRMIGLLGDEDSDVRQLAVESIADLMHTENVRSKLFEQDVMGPLLLQFTHKSWRVRQSSVQTITAMLQYPDARSRFFEIEAITRVLDLFGDEDVDVRNASVEAINAILRYEDARTKFFDSNAPGLLLGQFTNEDHNVRQSSLTVITAMIHLDNARTKLLKTNVIARFLGLFSDKDDDVRRSFVKAITEMMQFADSRAKLLETYAISHLLSLFADKVWTVQQLAAEAITAMLPFEEARARLLETDAIKALLILSGDKDSDVQLAALNAIIKMFQYDNARIKLLKSEAITRLIGLFIDSSWRVRQLAVDAFLTMIPYDNARSKLIETDVMTRLLGVLSDDDVDVRNSSVQVVIAMMPFAEFRNQLLEARFVDHLMRSLEHSESSRRLLAVELIRKLATYGVFRTKMLEAKVPGLLVERFVDYDTQVQRGAFDSMAQFVKHDETARDLVVSHLLPAYSINMLPSESESDSNYAWTPWYQCISRAAENDSCRCKLVDGGLLTVFVDMLRDPSGYYKTLALHAIADFTKYSEFRDALVEYTFVTPLVAVLRDCDRVVQCPMFVTITQLAKHDNLRRKILESSFVHCLVMTLSHVTSEGLPSQMPEFPTSLLACVTELLAHSDTSSKMTEWGYVPSMVNVLRPAPA